MSKQYRQEGSSLYDCNYIVSFCTKYRRKVLNEDMKKTLKEILIKISKTYNFSIKNIEISDFQVILEVNCSPELGIKTVVNKLKNLSAPELKELYPELNSRIPSIWTRETYIKSIGKLNKEDIDIFVKLQKKYETYNTNN